MHRVIYKAYFAKQCFGKRVDWIRWGWLTHINYQPLFYYFVIVWRCGVSLHMSEWVGVLHSSVTIVQGVNFHFTKLVVQTIQKCNFSTSRGQFQDTEIRASRRCLASYSQMRALSPPWFPLRSIDWTSLIKSNDHEAPYIYFYSEHLHSQVAQARNMRSASIGIVA